MDVTQKRSRHQNGSTRDLRASVASAIANRRSTMRVSDEHPSDWELDELVKIAVSAPDHGYLRPWRLVLLRGSARLKLADALAESAPEKSFAQAESKVCRAPLLISVVLSTRKHPKVPEWEQLAATVGMVTNLSLLLHVYGWAASWRTGRAVDAESVRKCLGLGRNEKSLGWLYVGGHIVEDANSNPRPPMRWEEHVSAL